jgi:hypothetical protein
MADNAKGKLVFSNPATPDSASKPVMKSLSEVPAFAQHHAAAAAVHGARVPQVAVYEAPPDVTVTPQNPLIISGSGPVSVKFGTVTIEPGGQIFVYTTADISIEVLDKK